MSDLRDLYQEVILDHSRSPRNFGHHEPSNREAKGNNPLCGDKFTVYALVEDGIVKDVSFEGRGCAISTASASLMTELVKGKTEEQAKAMFECFHQLVTADKDEPLDEALDKLNVLAGVRGYPMRVKCATLAWHTMNAALEGTDDTVVTE
ncbi:MAG: SUF system NifU family Fe-S cluster assembly protein [Alphaproteobacteria bacterium]|nr:SUF system NifU family Fe-S cluster assembly protein [Alphaproteobacteria bacterium]